MSLGLRVEIWPHSFVTSALYGWLVHVPTVWRMTCRYQVLSWLDGPREKALSSPDTMIMQVAHTHFLQNMGQQYEYHTHAQASAHTHTRARARARKQARTHTHTHARAQTHPHTRARAHRHARAHTRTHARGI